MENPAKRKLTPEEKFDLKLFRERNKVHFGNEKGRGNASLLEKAMCRQNQAERVLNKFGGATNLVRLVKEVYPDSKLAVATVQRWKNRNLRTNPAGGIIPATQMYMLLYVARLHGIYLTPKDCFPGML